MRERVRAYKAHGEIVPNIWDAEIITNDLRHGHPEDTNGGHYVCRAEFYSPSVGEYFAREVWSYHGDIEPYPYWERLTLPEYFEYMRWAVKRQAELYQ